MERFMNDSTGHGFSYVFERVLGAGEIVIVKMPPISPNKRGVNDIGWQADGDVTLCGTLSRKPEDGAALWQEIEVGDEINKTVSAIKIKNNSDKECSVVIRALLC